MNSLRENLTASHKDAWTNHLKKLGQSPENAQFPPPVALARPSSQSFSRLAKWGKVELER
ncbi:MAG: hypothetical protein ACI9SC_003095 [Gammaproteobacteria bacterium]|jgi:hypothetical protein